MTDKASGDDTDDTIVFGSELSDREVYSIGKIVSLWGALEHEIFWQTFRSLNPDSIEQLPKDMNNQPSSRVLALWKKHVVDEAEGSTKLILQEIYEKIQETAPFRNAIVHGMWVWSASEPEKVEVSRVKGDKIIAHQFTADELGQFALMLAKINFRIRYPGGFEEYVEARANENYVSRQFNAIATNSPSAKDWLALRDIFKDIEP